MFFTYLRPKQTADMTSWVDNYIIPLNIFNRFVSENKLSFGSSWARLTNDTARGWDGWKRCVKEMEKVFGVKKHFLFLNGLLRRNILTFVIP